MPVALITGITGQDGGYLAEQLVGEGWQVHGTSQPGESLPAHLTALGDCVQVHKIDFRNSSDLTKVLRLSEPAEVYNLAGVSSVGLSWEQPVLTAEVNGVAVAVLLQAIREQQHRTGNQIRFLQASSAEIFAGSGISPQDESTPVVPTSPYGAAKAFAHHLCSQFRTLDVFATSVILYNHESPRRPDTFVTRKITKTVAAIAEGRATELVLGNLSPRRDWGWAPEYVEAMVLALRHTRPDDFVFATGVGHSVEEFVAAAFAKVGMSDWRPYVKVATALSRGVDPGDLVGDASRATAALGWTPQVALDDLVGLMVEADLSAGSATALGTTRQPASPRTPAAPEPDAG